jgi:hypothetical protein
LAGIPYLIHVNIALLLQQGRKGRRFELAGDRHI